MHGMLTTLVIAANLVVVEDVEDADIVVPEQCVVVVEVEETVRINSNNRIRINPKLVLLLVTAGLMGTKATLVQSVTILLMVIFPMQLSQIVWVAITIMFPLDSDFPGRMED